MLGTDLLWRGHRGLVLPAHQAPPRRLPSAHRPNVLGGFGEAEDRHVGVDRLEVAALHDKGLVEDAHAPVLAHRAVEALLGRQVRVVGVAGEPFELLERAPVLQDGGPPAVDEELGAKEALLRVLVELLEHGGGIARIVGSHFLIAKGLFMRIPIMKTTKGSSVLAVNLPGTTWTMRITS
jgi:hypothetical protein